MLSRHDRADFFLRYFFLGSERGLGEIEVHRVGGFHDGAQNFPRFFLISKINALGINVVPEHWMCTLFQPFERRFNPCLLCT